MSNASMGSRFERDICNDLYRRGWYVINIPRNGMGQQPVDLIAVKQDEVLFADCKVCSGTGFVFERIEENQRQSMRLFDTRTSHLPFFIIRLPEGDVYVIYYCVFEQMEAQGFRRMRNSEIRRYGIPWETFMEDYLK